MPFLDPVKRKGGNVEAAGLPEVLKLDLEANHQSPRAMSTETT